VSLICRMVVGYFDHDQAYARNIAIDRPLDPERVRRLQAVCDELFAIELRLADYLTEQGVLVIVDGIITRDMFRVAYVAHELFGVVAVDNAHRDKVYPRPDWKPQSLDSLMQEASEFRSDWDEAQVQQDAACRRPLRSGPARRRHQPSSPAQNGDGTDGVRSEATDMPEATRKRTESVPGGFRTPGVPLARMLEQTNVLRARSPARPSPDL
jgi:hypothetical protein